MCKLRQVQEEALVARNAAVDALMYAALNTKSLSIEPLDMDLHLNPEVTPLHTAYDDSLHNSVPDDMIEKLRDIK